MASNEDIKIENWTRIGEISANFLTRFSNRKLRKEICDDLILSLDSNDIFSWNWKSLDGILEITVLMTLEPDLDIYQKAKIVEDICSYKSRYWYSILAVDWRNRSQKKKWFHEKKVR